MAEQDNTIQWTPEKLIRLKKAIKTAEDAGKEQFVLEDEGRKLDMLVSYAKYLAQFLDSQLRVK